MRCLSSLLSIALTLLILVPPASAATITVDKAKGQTIQAAIDSAAQFDTVLVGPGIYAEHVDFKGKNIVLTSTLSTDHATIAAAAKATIIDGSDTGPAVTSSAARFTADEPRDFTGFVLSYFTIQHGGSSTPGLDPASYGGIFMPYNDFSVIGNIITQNNFGGISVARGAYVEVALNTITQNTCWGIVIVGGGVNASDNEISATQTPATGCSITDVRGTFRTNSSGVLIDGSGIPGVYGSSDIRGNNIESNVQIVTPGAPVEGGAAIAIYSGGATIHSNFIRFNSAPFARGGAIDIAAGAVADPANLPPARATVSVIENVIYRNQAGCGGAAIAFNSNGLDRSSGSVFAVSAYTLLVANNTIADNIIVADPAGGCPADAQIYTQIDATQQGLASPDVLFLNNVISGGVSTVITDCNQQDAPSIYNQAVYDHNLLSTGGGAIFGSSCVDESAAPLNVFFGNVVAYPEFMNSAIGDYRLTPSSPGVDAGNNAMVLTVDDQLGYYAFDSNLAPNSSNSTRGDLADYGDFNGEVRIQDSTGKLDGTGQETDVIDIGAYEVHGTVLKQNPLTLAISTVGLPKNPGPATLTAYIRAGSTVNALNLPESFVPSGTVTFFVDGSQVGDPAAIASIPSPIDTYDVVGIAYGNVNLGSGVHVLTATFQPEPKVDSTQSVALVVKIEKDLAVYGITLTANPYYTSVGSPITFTATEKRAVSGSYPTPLTLRETNSGAVLDTIAIDPMTGVGTYTTTNLAPGYSIVQASFAGSSDIPSLLSNAVSVEIVAPTALTVSTETNPAQAFTPFNLSAKFTGSAPPTSGFISFYATSTQPGSFATAIGRATISAEGTAVLAASLPAGIYIIMAKYAGDALNGAATSPGITETVVGVTTQIALASTLNPAYAFQPIPLTAHVTGPSTSTGNITGTITFLANGKPIGSSKIGTDGNATLNPGLPAGSYTLSANFPGNDSFAPSTSNPVAEVVKPNTTLSNLDASPNPAYQRAEVSLHAAVFTSSTASTLVVPTGTVTFLDAGIPIITSPLDATGIIIFSTTTFTVGTHTLTAVYAGTPDFFSSTSNAFDLTILPQDFTLTAGQSFTLKTERHGNLNATLTSVGNFADTIGLACGNLPAFATCSFPMNGLALASGATVAATVRIDTDALFDYTSGLQRPTTDPNTTDSRNAIALALLLPMALLANRRRGRSLRLFIPLVALVVATALIGCSGHQPGHTPPGSYNITITGTGATTHLTHTATISLIVTQ